MGRSGVPGPQRLDHLTGARCLISAWIVCGHFLPVLDDSAFTKARHRGDAGVCFFIMLSGFVTQWAYASRLADGSLGEIRSFYVRRIGRVVVTTWLAMLLGLCVVVIQLRGGLPPFGHLLRCFAFVEPWFDPIDWCPNGQTWTVAALLPNWLLYPLTCRALAFVERSTGGAGLLALCCLLALASIGPLLALFAAQGGDLTLKQGAWGYIWPPATLPDFTLGAAVAALARRPGRADAAAPGAAAGAAAGWSPAARGRIADLAALLVVAACLGVPPSPAGPRAGYEALFSHAFAPLLACFLYGSVAEGGAGIVAAILRHDALAGLGEYSFEVYLFQYPVHEIFVAAGDLSMGAFTMRNAAGTHNTNSCGFVVFFLTLWLVSGLYSARVERHLVNWLRGDGPRGHDRRDGPARSGAEEPRPKDGPQSLERMPLVPAHEEAAGGV